jgi:translation initiation factor 2 beta subunit (eIF-2beta)/eIF-5
MSEIKKGILSNWVATTTKENPPFQIFLEKNKLMQNVKNKTMTAADLDKIKAVIKGKFNHPDAEQLIINFIKILNNDKE